MLLVEIYSYCEPPNAGANRRAQTADFIQVPDENLLIARPVERLVRCRRVPDEHLNLQAIAGIHSTQPR
jgi:hypothetical protein